MSFVKLFTFERHLFFLNIFVLLRNGVAHGQTDVSNCFRKKLFMFIIGASMIVSNNTIELYKISDSCHFKFVFVFMLWRSFFYDFYPARYF